MAAARLLRVQDDADVLDEQLAYYRRRAPAYDEWWQRRGPYDRGETANAAWKAEVAEVEAALDAFGAGGDVLELAGGTGWWTARLARTARRLTVVDASPEAIALNRARVARHDVGYVVDDLFTWSPPRAHAYDVVFFSFWLSHVPRARTGAFWSLVATCLAPGGRAFLVDSRDDPARVDSDPYTVRVDDDVHRRRLGDGSEHRVFKVFYEPDELGAQLYALGWEADLRATASSFVYGSARRAAAGRP